MSLPVNTWLLLEVEEERKENRQLLCGILAQELLSHDMILAQLSHDGDGDGDGLGNGENNHEAGCAKCIKYNTIVMFFLSK